VPNLVVVAVVVQFAVLLLFGVRVATLVAVATTMAVWLGQSSRRATLLGVGIDVLSAVAATQAAGAAYAFAGGAAGWPWPRQAIPVTAAVLAYSAVAGTVSEVLSPLLRRERLRASWPNDLGHYLGTCVIAAAVAVGLVELVQRHMWEMLLLVAVPLYCVYRTYANHFNWVEHDQRQREALEALDEGIAVVDRSGRVVHWNVALERIVGASRERMLGNAVAEALPAVGKTELPRVIEQVLGGESSMAVAQVALAAPAGPPRLLQVKVLPVPDGVSLVWQDVTARRRAEEGLKRQEERLALAADGAHDGLWEWDLNAKELFFSARWKAMLGLPAVAGVGRPEEWLGRVHPEDIAPLKEALESHLAGTTDHFEHEHRIQHEDGSYRWFMCRGVAAHSPTRRSARIGGSMTDTTERAHTQERLRSAGFLDSLTGLCNRAVFVERLGKRLEECRQGRGGRFALLYLDLDRFKVVNDSLGHLVGDELLVAVSRRLESCVRPGDSLARLGGDEFAILVSGLAEDQQANAMAFRIQEALRAPLAIAGREVFTSASIGIALGPAQYTDPDAIMRDADTAMYHAKSRGKARHELFDADMHARVRDRLGLENDLRHAVASNNFEVHYQPIVLLGTGMCVGFESLVRWTRNGESVPPVNFIPMAEELGLIEPLGTWVMQEACRTFAEWQRRYPDSGLDCITVNVSSRQLMQQNFLRIVERAVQKAGLRPSAVRIEITETALLDSPATAAELLRELRDFGVKIYLDDFGTGYSSLSHLHKLPVDALKIDRSFVKSLLLPDRPAIVESVLALARTLNTSVVAEGIETERQARELERLGCTHAQGFLFSKPLSERMAEDLIIANQPLGPKRATTQAAAGEIDVLIPAGRFEWPEHIPLT
jgi:diguanylate cyclase (GGDEF)-like protein/PAS domain S-box-containing protein